MPVDVEYMWMEMGHVNECIDGHEHVKLINIML